jgi:enediyne biosynthesis protein E4
VRRLLLPVLVTLLGCPTVEEPPEALPPLFVDATATWGVDFDAPRPETPPLTYPHTRAGGGGALDDLDGDGDLDLLLTAPFGSAALYLNEGDRFEPKGSGAGIEGIESLLDVTAADLDGDDLPDLVVCAGRDVRLFHNVGGSFEEAAPLLTTSESIRPVATTVADVNGDGHPDVYVLTWGVSEDYGFDPVPGHDRFLLGRGDLVFDEAPDVFPDTGGLSFSAIWLDLEPDGDLDLFVVRYDALHMGGASLFVQGDDGRFEDVAPGQDLDVADNGMGVDVADLQGDGTLEFLISDTDHRVLALSLTGLGALDVSAPLNTFPSDFEQQRDSWGVVLQDVDDDGDLDLLTPWGNKDADPSYPPQRPSLWTWEGQAFVDADGALPHLLSHAWRSVLPGDLDGDGTLDLVWTSAVGPASIQLGRPTGNHHLEVQLPPGRGQGALVEVDGMKRRLTAGGSGLHASLPTIARFGLGPRNRADLVRVSWPDGEVTERRDVAADQRLILW